MSPAMVLEELYKDPGKIVVTAHRGFSGLYPENTLVAFQAAVDIGADIIEFDIRGTRDRVPVISHDPTVDRRSNGSGAVADHSYEELRRLDFSGGSGAGIPIPTFEEALAAIPSSLGLNIQVKETEPDLLEQICELYHRADLYRRGYLTLSTFDGAEAVRSIDPRVELCILERKQTLNGRLIRRMKDFGCRFLQPHRRDMTPELCDEIRESGLFANVFYSNSDADNRLFIGYGIRGILTDRPDILIETIGATL